MEPIPVVVKDVIEEIDAAGEAAEEDEGHAGGGEE
jgi:hypothetical protein